MSINVSEFFSIIRQALKCYSFRMFQEQKIHSLYQWFHLYFFSIIREHHCTIFGNRQSADSNQILQFVIMETQSPDSLIASLTLVVFIEHIIEDIIRRNKIEERHARPDLQHIRKSENIICALIVAIKKSLCDFTKMLPKYWMIQISLCFFFAVNTIKFRIVTMS